MKGLRVLVNDISYISEIYMWDLFFVSLYQIEIQQKFDSA